MHRFFGPGEGASLDAVDEPGGLAVGRTKILIYGLSGFFSALAGVAYSVALLSGHGLYANTLEMDAISSVVIGGTLLTGGVGYVFARQQD